jgi:signal transduction histidine kinase
VSLKSLSPERCRFTVSDDGIGFDPGAARLGMGGRLIKATVAQLHGSYSYASGPGTTFSAEIAVHGKPEIQPAGLPAAA